MEAPFAQPASAVMEGLGVRARDGLDEGEVSLRQARHGPNRLRRHRPRRAWAVLLDQFRSLLVALLVAAMILAAISGDWLEAAAIAVVTVVNAAIGFVSEIRAVRSMAALRRLGGTTATVRRRGAVRRIGAEELVPGDIVLIGAGDVVSADLRIIDASKLQADESLLTGESAPVDKDDRPVEADAAVADRRGMLFKGTAVTRGSAEAVVCATGMDTELGRIHGLLLESAEEQRTPLERRLDHLGRALVALALGIAVIVAVLGIVAGHDPRLIVKTSIALAVAAVPEGLPVVATLALARGMWRMARRHALINRLAAVETLGAVTVILTDKTGTLTENQMTVRRIATGAGETAVSGAAFDDRGEFRRDGDAIDPAADPELRALLEIGVLCNEATWDRNAAAGAPAGAGEPMEVALIVAGAKAGIEQAPLRAALPEVEKIAFDPAVNMMATYHRRGDRALRVAVKGAPEAVLQACSHVRSGAEAAPLDEAGRGRWLGWNDRLADSGLRMLALAERSADAVDDHPYAGLTLLGLVGMVDPPRPDVRSAIESCRDAGIRVVMVTGDHPSTATRVAEAVGIASDVPMIVGRDLPPPDRMSDDDAARLLAAPIFARVNPAQKLQLLGLHQRHGALVAMTGDGVNDAPALQSADIGIAMGRRGTDVAREAADVVLRDDSFTSIVAAIAQGRVIFDNIRTFIRYLLSCNLSEIIVVLLGVIAGTPLPILPLQILFLNLVTDVFPALALGLGEGDPRIMARPPRDPGEPVLARRHWIQCAVDGCVLAVAVLGSLLLSLHWLGFDERRAVTVSFLTLAFAQLWHVFDMRMPGSNPLLNQVTRNRHVWIAIGLCTALLVAAVHVPLLTVPLETVNPGRHGWLVVAAMSAAPVALIQLRLTIGVGDRRAGP